MQICHLLKKMSKINFFDTDIEGRNILKRRIFWIWRKNLKFMSFYGYITDIPKERKKKHTEKRSRSVIFHLMIYDDNYQPLKH